MTLHVFGSINIDHVYRLARFPEGGETLVAVAYAVSLGGKGANQAIAAAKAGAQVHFIGAVGSDGAWAREALERHGVGVDRVRIAVEATGHAIIFVEPSGENRIVIHGGANRSVSRDDLEQALRSAQPGDWWLAQNETNLVVESMAMARGRGLRTAYAAAPFDAEAAAEVLPHVDALFVNEGEDQALRAHLPDAVPAPLKIITLGARGAIISKRGEPEIVVPACKVEPIDTTGAGDTFTGVFLASLDAGLDLESAGRTASAAAALCVTRAGAAEAAPSRAEIEALLSTPQCPSESH
jgi:ribokinase